MQISYASEKDKDGKKDDPVKVTYFYAKETPWEAFPGDDPVSF